MGLEADLELTVVILCYGGDVFLAHFRVDLWWACSPSSTREASLAHFHVFNDPYQNEQALKNNTL